VKLLLARVEQWAKSASGLRFTWIHGITCTVIWLATYSTSSAQKIPLLCCACLVFHQVVVGSKVFLYFSKKEMFAFSFFFMKS
jgi:hypothetical protein